MSEFGIICSTAVLAVAVAAVALSIAAKLADWETTGAIWPVTGALRRVAGPVPVTAMECLIVAAALSPSPVPVRLSLIGAVFTGYALAALSLRGHRCACFGSWIPTRFTMRHAIACAVVAALSYTGTIETPGVWTATVDAAAGLAVAAMVAVWLRHRSAAEHARVTADIHRIVIFTAEECRFCAALQAQRDRYEAMARCPIEFRRAETEADAEVAGGAFPAAVAYGPDGAPVCKPVHGMAGIRDLLRQSTHRREPQVTT